MTGLYDVNGKELAVGDIILIDLSSTQIDPNYWYPCYKVIYKAPSFQLEYLGGAKDSSMARWSFTQSKNVHVLH
jgi:hypothetical protein